jgi:hypothetical protein
LTLLLFALPGLVVDHDLAGARIAPQDRLNAVNNTRATFLQAVGGLVVLFGAWATWRQLRVSQDGLRATQDGYITDRFSRAVDQLGSEKLDVRIGGLHALWRISEESPRDREAAISIQAAFLRTHIPWPPTAADAPAADVPIDELAPLEVRAPDVQIALTGLGVLCEHHTQAWVDLGATDLRRADCDGLWLNGVNLPGLRAGASGLRCGVLLCAVRQVAWTAVRPAPVGVVAACDVALPVGAAASLARAFSRSWVVARFRALRRPSRLFWSVARPRVCWCQE